MVVCKIHLLRFSGYFTVTVTTAFLLPDFTVIFAVPFPFAVTFPVELTVATFLLEVVKVTFS